MNIMVKPVNVRIKIQITNINIKTLKLLIKTSFFNIKINDFLCFDITLWNTSLIEEATKCLFCTSLRSTHSTRMCFTLSGHWQVPHQVPTKFWWDVYRPIDDVQNVRLLHQHRLTVGNITDQWHHSQTEFRLFFYHFHLQTSPSSDVLMMWRHGQGRLTAPVNNHPLSTLIHIRCS